MILPDLLKHLQLDKFIAVDIETTGLEFSKDAIIEISAYKFINGNPAEEYTSLILPHKSIPAEIVELTGITNAMVEKAPVVKNVLPKMVDFIGNTPLVGHDIGFDLKFLTNELDNIDSELQPTAVYDTLSLARTFFYFLPEFNLEALSEYFGLSKQNSHRASVDSFNAGKIFINLITEAASCPLPLLQKIHNIILEQDIPNYALFKNLYDTAVKLKCVNGLTTSKIDKYISGYKFSYNPDTESKLPKTPADWFKKDGKITKNWHNYESRQSQIDLANDVFTIFENNNILLAEAGAGLGKSLAYLAGGFLQCKRAEKPLIVSTYTKTLQDQLFNKDIPHFAHTINEKLSAIILKGRHNYLCRTRLKNVIENASDLLDNRDRTNILPILIWEEYTKSGDISECMGFHRNLNSKIWNMLKSEPGFCTGDRCRQFDGCFLRKIRNDIKKADIIIVNHFLLLSELFQEANNLPEDFNFVIDEGHNLQLAAREQLVNRISSNSFDEIFRYFSKENKILKKCIEILSKSNPEIKKAFLDIQKYSGAIKQQLRDFFIHYQELKKELIKNDEYMEHKWTYRDSASEFRLIITNPREIIKSLKNYSVSVEKLLETMNSANENVGIDFLPEMKLQIRRLSELIIIFDKVINVTDENIVWSTIIRRGIVFTCSLHYAPRDIEYNIFETIFKKETGGMVCSATLAIDGDFKFIQESFGLTQFAQERNVESKIYNSPFHFNDQVKAFSFSSSLNIHSDDFMIAIANQIANYSINVSGRILILCTSFKQARMLKKYIIPQIKKTNRKLFVQLRNKNRRAMIQGYLNHSSSILIGTASFWEGIDLPGNKVETLILIKIPFANPSEPLIKAQVEKYQNIGRNAFFDFQVPEATVKFKQGFGRLIRSLDDMGICIITDPRLQSMAYGQTILNSLPVEVTSYSNIRTVIEESNKFFRNQYSDVINFK